jgi:hypothetical protein
MDKQVTRHGRFEVATATGASGQGFYGWAKEGEIVGENAIEEPGEPVWFDFGATRDEVVAKLLREVGALS